MRSAEKVRIQINDENFRPLRIDFRMRTPVCLTYPFIFFDGVVAHLMNRYLDPEGFRALPSKRVVREAAEVNIPIKRFYFNGDYFYHASVSIFDVEQAYTTTIYKRFCERYLNLDKVRRRKISRGSGFFRDYMINLVYIPARKVTFYAFGDPEALEFLLNHLSALGKKTSIGFGMIKDFTVKEIDEDYSIIKDGRAMRSIPLDAVEFSEETVLMAYKTPYWAKENVKPCVPPFARCKLWKGSGGNTS